MKISTLRWRIGIYMDRISLLEGPRYANCPTVSELSRSRWTQEALTLRSVIIDLKHDYYPKLEDIIIP